MMFELAKAELRHLAADLRGASRSSTAAISAETRRVLADLDGPGDRSPSPSRRIWRAFRRTPAPLQVALALGAFACWAYLVIELYPS
jgi:hypothetical protein